MRRKQLSARAAPWLIAALIVAAAPRPAEASVLEAAGSLEEARSLEARASLDVPVSLGGSLASMIRQNAVANARDLLFARTPGELIRLERRGVLVRVQGNDDFDVAPSVRWPVARPELVLFIQRLAADYRAATGEKLVVTSLARPTTRQPPNAHELSVHPAGVAVDLRVSRRAASREWLESTLLSLEAQGLLDVTREYYPPHYHVALFPEAYMELLEARVAAVAVEASLHPRGREPAGTSTSGAVAHQATPPARALVVVLPVLLLIPLYRRRRLSPDRPSAPPARPIGG